MKNRSIGFVLVASLGFFMPVMASESVSKEAVADCAAIASPTDRVVCYDRLANANGLTAAAAKKTGNWRAWSKKDPLTDESIYMAILPANKESGKKLREIVLGVKCESNVTDVLINWDTLIGIMEDSVAVTDRVGKDPSRTQKWSTSTDGTTTFMPNPVGTLKKMIDNDSFVARITPSNQSTITAIFDISGAGDALEDIRKACNW